MMIRGAGRGLLALVVCVSLKLAVRPREGIKIRAFAMVFQDPSAGLKDACIVSKFAVCMLCV